MRMKSTALLAVGILSFGISLPGSARCQTSLAPPLSLARPAAAPEVAASPPAVIMASPPTAAEDAPPPAPVPPQATARRAAIPVARDIPKPAADHDGFTATIEDEPVQKLPELSRTAKRSKSMKEPDGIAGRSSADFPDDEPLRRKLNICRDCK
jgi:hypothetical protein